MEFCEKCGGIIRIESDKAICVSCGYRPRKKLKITTSEKLGGKGDVPIIKKENEVHPIIDMKCTKCKNKKTYFWTQQTRASDESETKFFKCTKCGHTWRDYK